MIRKSEEENKRRVLIKSLNEYYSDVNDNKKVKLNVSFHFGDCNTV